MKAILVIFAAIFVVFNSVAQAAVITTPVTNEDFATVFKITDSKPVTGSGAVWYAQFQAGNTASNSNTFEQWEIEIGGSAGATDYGHTIWEFLGTYQFNIAIDSANNLTAIFNGAGAGDGYPVVGAFNEVWVQLRVVTVDPLDTINVTNHQVNSLGLPNMSVTSTPTTLGQSFKFHFDDKLSNIGQIDLSGEMFLDVFDIGAVEQEWTYTVVGVYNPEIVPEPSSFLFLLFATALSVFVRRASYRSNR